MGRIFDGRELGVQLTGRLPGTSHRPSRLVLLSPEGVAGFPALGYASRPSQRPTLSGMLLWGSLLSSNPAWLEWTQIDRPRVPELSAAIVSDEPSRSGSGWRCRLCELTKRGRS